eukprot:GILK01001415.1.p1 GENE.GILK01001415.1~~GILK01001415.1.p1  ORF type:complete len:813 (-),score=157.91 GILK01001415.1:340-2727(-)
MASSSNGNADGEESAMEAAIQRQLQPLIERINTLEQALKAKDDQIVVLTAAVANLSRNVSTTSAAPAKGNKPVPVTASTERERTAMKSKKDLTPASNTMPSAVPPVPVSPVAAKARPSTSKPAPAKRPVVAEDKPKPVRPKTAEPVPVTRESSRGSMADDGIRATFGRQQTLVFSPTNFQPASDAAAAPQESLQLDYVHGYNGKNGRHNLHFPDDQHIVYSIAGLGVVHDVANNTQQFFSEHNEDVLCLTVNKAKRVAATGQLDPKGAQTPYVCVWDLDETKQRARLYYHEKGVIGVSFSPDGSKLVTIGDDAQHSLAVWSWEEAVGKETSADPKKRPSPIAPLATGQADKERVLGVEWDPHSTDTLRFVTYGVRHIKLWTLRDTSLTSERVIFHSTEPPKAVACAVYHPNGSLLAGADNGSVYVVTGKEVTHSFKAHEGTVSEIVVNDDGTFWTFGFDGNMTLWSATNEMVRTVSVNNQTEIKVRSADICNGKAVVGSTNDTIYLVDLLTSTSSVVNSGHFGEVWGLAVHPSLPVIATAAEDKVLRCFDSISRAPLEGKYISFEQKARAVDFHPNGSHIAVGFADGSVRVVNFETFQVEKEMHDAKETVDAIKYSADGSLLAAGSWDQKIYLYTVADGYSKSHVLTGNTSSVTHLVFSADSKYVLSNSKDTSILFWEVSSGKRVNRPSTLRDIAWDRWTAVMGWPVIGIWNGEYDLTDVNGCAQNNSGTLLAIGDDFGLVKLFKYPSCVPKAAFKAYTGHSAHVTNIRFAHDDAYVFSTGGNDSAVFQWKVVRS